MFHLNRDLAAREIQWRARKLYFLEAWSYAEATSAHHWNFRTGFLEEFGLEAWLNQRGDFAPPVPPAGVGRPHGGIRLLACHYTLFKWAAVGLSHEAFELVESGFQLHPATLPALEVATGTFSRYFRGDNKLSIILKAPQKYEIGNHMLSLTHDFSSRWTTALLAGESIVTGALSVENVVPVPLGSLSPCVVIRAYLSASSELWDHPITLPCIILNNHLRRLQKHCSGDLTPCVMDIEEQLGVTRVGRRNSERLSRTWGGSKDTAGRPVERIRAEYLTVNINTELTRVRFTSHNPKWNYEASTLLLDVMRDINGFSEQRNGSHDEIASALEHNITLAKSLEEHVHGLQKRLELQLNVLYSFVAQTDNRLSARLAASAGRDSTSMKILAFITTIFLPGSFVATLFSMEMFTWEAASDSDGASVSPSFWIYWAVAAPLTGLTLCGWALWWSFEKHRYDEHLQDSVNSVGEVMPPPWWQRLLRRPDTRPDVASAPAFRSIPAEGIRIRQRAAPSPEATGSDSPGRLMRRVSRTR